MDIEEYLRLATGELTGPIRIGRVRPNVKKSLNAHTQAVWLSRESVEKQCQRHSKLPLEFYEHLPSAIEHGIGFRMFDQRVSLVLDLRSICGYRLNAVVKATTGGHELFAISYYPLRERDWDRLQRKHNRIH